MIRANPFDPHLFDYYQFLALSTLIPPTNGEQSIFLTTHLLQVKLIGELKAELANCGALEKSDTAFMSQISKLKKEEYLVINLNIGGKPANETV